MVSPSPPNIFYSRYHANANLAKMYMEADDVQTVATRSFFFVGDCVAGSLGSGPSFSKYILLLALFHLILKLNWRSFNSSELMVFISACSSLSDCRSSRAQTSKLNQNWGSHKVKHVDKMMASKQITHPRADCQDSNPISSCSTVCAALAR